MDLNASGYRAAIFSYATDDNSSVGQLELKVIPGILDRNFNVKTNGKYEHQFIYMPVINPATGRVWLNNNLGAEYANANNPNGNFNPTQQATASNDYKAYGSLFQWGRKADGHELINWESASKGTPIHSGTTQTQYDNPSHSSFITSPKNNWRATLDETLWASESSPNNVCPVGYRLPLDPNGAEDSLNEFNAERKTWNSQNAAGALASNLRLTIPGYRWWDGTIYIERSTKYWTGTHNSRDQNGAYSYAFELGANIAQGGNSNPSSGSSVRCIKD